MEGFKANTCPIAISATLLVLSIISVNGQITTPCTASMISTFTPCLNFITGSTSNGSSPTASCCSSIPSLMTGSMDCFCLVVTGNVPLPLPINRTLAITLPRACKQGGVPIKCKASGVPLPAPGPALFGPSPPPVASSPFSPKASKASALVPPAAAPAPEATFEDSPASPPLHSEDPTTTPGIRPVLTPTSASNPSYAYSQTMLLILLGIILLKC